MLYNSPDGAVDDPLRCVEETGCCVFLEEVREEEVHFQGTSSGSAPSSTRAVAANHRRSRRLPIPVNKHKERYERDSNLPVCNVSLHTPPSPYTEKSEFSRRISIGRGLF